jgi:Flp pilus assembly pilin Flp
LISRIWADESGATAIEYALIVGIMSLVVVAIAATGGALDAVYQKVYNIIAALST